MSQFNRILTTRELRHNGQPLWKYNLSDTEFYRLKYALMGHKSLNAIDPKDCTLYYAEWWKRCYNGGFPSKKDVFNSIANGQYFNDEEFYKHAKIGATLLGIQWIKNQNTLFFRTLLLQGGLPIKHISSHKGAYKNFLLKILEVNPNNIDDFAFDSSITSLLPASSQNDAVYECCLHIVKAINNEGKSIFQEDKEYLSILDDNQELNEISRELRIKKESLRSVRRKPKSKITWVFELDKEQIRLYFGIPEMDSEDFRSYFLDNDPNVLLDFEYKLFYNNQIICKFTKKINNQYKVIWVNQSDIIWDGSEQLSELYLVNTDGKKYDCKDLITYIPKLNRPTLWIKYSDVQWILEKGSHTSEKEAFVLYPENYIQNINADVESLSICGKPFKWTAFTNAIVLSNHLDQYQFKTNCKKIEWYIVDEKPNWMQRANLPVVRKMPKVRVFDESGSIIYNAVFKWRQKPSHFWNSWNMTIPKGLIELQINVDGVVEFDEFFNIDYLEVKRDSNCLHQAEVELVNNTFLFNINENQLVTIEKVNADKIKLKLRSNNCLPNAIQASLKTTNQSRGLRFEILPPFKGVEIIDNKQNIVTNGSCFNLTNLNGYRLLSNIKSLVVNIYNTKRPSIVISERLEESFFQLRLFEDKINQLYTLSDTLDGDAEIVLELCEESSYHQIKHKEYRVKRYDQKIDWSFDEHNKLTIHTNYANAELYAIPLDCPSKELHLYDLENNNGRYCFRSALTMEKYVVFCSKESGARIQPTLIFLKPENEFTKVENRLQRIIGLKDELLRAAYNEDAWDRFLSYYKVCLNNDLPFSTFDNLRAVGFSSALAAKSFVFLLCYDETQSFIENTHKEMEQDLGFSFHWANRVHWEKAMDWIDCSKDENLSVYIQNGVKSYFDNLYPSVYFSQVFGYVSQETKPKINYDYFLNGRITSLRASLGPKVLSELPQKCPKVPEAYKNIIPINEANTNIKILLTSPLAVALSIAGKEEALWSKESEYIRRNVKYSYQLNPEWYSEAINYCLTRL